MRSGTNLPRVGGYNRAVILEAIRSRGEISRVELAELTGLTTQTVSNIVRRLLEAELVVEAGRLPSAGGKPRTALALNPHGAYAIGMHLDPDATVTVLMNLGGEVVARVRRRSNGGRSPRSTVQRLAGAIDQVIEKADIPVTAVAGVGVACPGPVDLERGLVVEPPNLAGWHEEPLVDALADRVGIPVRLDNDATAMAVGERWAGGADRAEPFAFLYLGTGIGGGLMLGETVHRGQTGNAGEFGHITVVPDGRPCHCGNRGCAEAHCSPEAMLADLRDRHGRRVAKRLGVTGTKTRIRSEYAQVCRAAAQGDPAAADVVDRAVHLLAQAAVSLVNVVDVRLLVVGGTALRHLESRLLPELTTAVNERTIARRLRTVRVERSVLGDDVGAVGAASLVLHGTYAPGWAQLLATGVA
ncbi:MAG: ROK family protein [Streptosporangiales bacterium]|nr:ROK family protein [Streptosporangiales bacterium]